MPKSPVSRLTFSAIITLLLWLGSANAQPSESLADALNANARDVNHLLRDDIRKPLGVIEFLGITNGMKVLDLYAADGYYTYILSSAVGPAGTVYAQNPAAGSNLEDIRQMYSLADSLDLTIAKASLTNVQHLRQGFFDLEIAAGSLDGVMLVQILHDFYNGDADYAAALLAQLKTLLKPGGFIGIIDHAGDAGQDNARLHRMQKSQLMELAQRVGLTIDGDSDLLSNPADRHRRGVFDPMLGRNSDRFLVKLTN